MQRNVHHVWAKISSTLLFVPQLSMWVTIFFFSASEEGLSCPAKWKVLDNEGAPSCGEEVPQVPYPRPPVPPHISHFLIKYIKPDPCSTLDNPPPNSRAAINTCVRSLLSPHGEELDRLHNRLYIGTIQSALLSSALIGGMMTRALYTTPQCSNISKEEHTASNIPKPGPASTLPTQNNCTN